MKQTKIIFIEWAEYASRADSLANAVGAKTIFIGKVNKHRNIFYSFSSYPKKIIKNYSIIKKHSPKIVYLTNTNWIVAFVNIIFSRLFDFKLILDSHSCAFDHEFFKYPLFLSKIFAKKANLSIVTNNSHKLLLENIGAKVLVISDIPFEDKLVTDEKIKLSDKFNICYICTFAPDEPYMEVIKAAKLNDFVKVYITGQFKRVNINPKEFPHVVFTGFISNEEYKKYLNTADAIMTLTTREDTMQRAGSETISVGKPLITSDTKMLRNYFTKGTIFVDNSSEGINNAFKIVLQEKENLMEGIKELKEIRKINFSKKLEILNKIEGK